MDPFSQIRDAEAKNKKKLEKALANSDKKTFEARDAEESSYAKFEQTNKADLSEHLAKARQKADTETAEGLKKAREEVNKTIAKCKEREDDAVNLTVKKFAEFVTSRP